MAATAEGEVRGDSRKREAPGMCGNSNKIIKDNGTYNFVNCLIQSVTRRVQRNSAKSGGDYESQADLPRNHNTLSGF